MEIGPEATVATVHLSWGDMTKHEPYINIISEKEHKKHG
jgi:hypothetical protein